MTDLQNSDGEASGSPAENVLNPINASGSPQAASRDGVFSREGSLDAPTRHPIAWQEPAFWDQDNLEQELERVFDICHGCRRCVSLCESFPTLFDLIDESDSFEIDSVDKADFQKVVDQCYLCDLCYMSKCPYVPPHEWQLDFPHLMLRAKAVKFKQQGSSVRNTLLSDTDKVGKLASIPLIDITVNRLNKQPSFRQLFEKAAGVHHQAPVPEYHHRTMRKRLKQQSLPLKAKPLANTRGKLALFASCYGNYNRPEIGEDIFKVFQHNQIAIELVEQERCCGMPKLELGDLDAVAKAKAFNIPALAEKVDQGYDLTALVPSCVLMFKQELPLLFPDDEAVKKVQQAFFDPFEYLHIRYKAGGMNTEFKQSLGDISYHIACHLRVQNIGIKAREILQLVPDTQVHVQERCSGHDGTYAVKAESYPFAVKIAKPLVKKLNQQQARFLSSDCPMAGQHLAELSDHSAALHPITLLRMAYDL